MIAKDGKCILCSSISEGLILKDGECICDPNIAEYNKTGKEECTICSSIHYNMISNNGKCECKDGTIPKISNNKTVCSNDKNCENSNFCINGICDDSSGNIICNCYNGFFGVNCSEGINAVNYIKTLNNIQKEIQSLVGNVTLNEQATNDLFSNNSLTNKIQQVSLLYKSKNVNIENQNEPIYETIKDFTMKVINLYNNNSTKLIENFTTFIEYIGFTLYYQKYSSNNRRLTEDKLISNKDIATLTKKINITNLEKNKLSSSVNNAFSYILWEFSPLNYDEYIQFMKNNNLTYIFKDNNLRIGTSILHTIINSSVTNESQSNQILTTLYYKNNIIQFDNINYAINYDSFNQVNEFLYSYYWDKGINIYNQNDDVFNDKCYRNKKLKYDLNTNYKKNSLYQGSIIVDSCKVNDDLHNEKIIYYSCDNDTSFYYSFFKNTSVLSLKDNYSLLPLKCLNKVKEIYNNLGFWIFLFLMISLIIITLYYSKSEKELLGDNINDDIIENDKLSVEITSTEKQEITTTRNIYYKPSFIDNLLYKLLNFHPITTLFKVSLLIQFQLKYWLLIFNISMLFGFNALLYSEKYIEKRIYDKHRNDFGYPMRKEFGKIISSILLTMILTFLIKLSNVTSLNKKRILAVELTGKENRFTVMNFIEEKKVFRLIAFSFMFILMIFMWIYSIGFCYIYYNSQINWLYSFIWSIFWLWIIFAPLIIVVSCIVEYYIQDYDTNEKINHYSNLLFCF